MIYLDWGRLFTLLVRGEFVWRNYLLSLLIFKNRLPSNAARTYLALLYRRYFYLTASFLCCFDVDLLPLSGSILNLLLIVILTLSLFRFFIIWWWVAFIVPYYSSLWIVMNVAIISINQLCEVSRICLISLILITWPTIRWMRWNRFIITVVAIITVRLLLRHFICLLLIRCLLFRRVDISTLQRF